MTRDDDFKVRPGRMRQGGPRSDTALRQVLIATRRAGTLGGAGGMRPGRASVFGRGRSGSVRAVRGLSATSRSVVIKARVVRSRAGSSPLAAHLRYLQRDGVTAEGTHGRLFDADTDRADVSGFGTRCDGDRHHFRFIVSPEDGAALGDLKAYTRDLMKTAEADLETRLDWVAVDHWNTPHPHVHVLVRGVADDGTDLVISRDYISQGLRARACALATVELGPRTERDVQQSLARDVGSDRWTRLDGRLVSDAAVGDGLIDLRPGRDRAAPLRLAKLARIEVLRDLGLASPVGTGRWQLSPELEPTLKAIGRRNDIIARMHEGLRAAGLDRGSEQILVQDDASAAVIGRVVSQGLDDELKGTGFLVIDGLDGRVRHHPVQDLTTLDVRTGSIVEIAPLEVGTGAGRMGVFVRADQPIEVQVSAEGATWLDRQLIRSDRPADGSGFGRAVREAIEQRIDHLQTLGLAHREGGTVRLVPRLLDTLRDRELAATAKAITGETGLIHRPVGDGDEISGTYRQRLALASGRFAMIDDGLGFTLVPWRPSLERRLGQPVSGTLGPGFSVTWSMSRGPGR